VVESLVLVADSLLLDVSDTARLSEEASGAISLCFWFAWMAAASSFDLTFSRMLLKRPLFTSAVVFSLINVFFVDGNCDIMAGVEYSNGGSASGISSIFEATNVGRGGPGGAAGGIGMPLLASS
jgi:hypothetical protein